jgi:hypothetical protein
MGELQRRILLHPHAADRIGDHGLVRDRDTLMVVLVHLHGQSVLR